MSNDEAGSSDSEMGHGAARPGEASGRRREPRADLPPELVDAEPETRQELLDAAQRYARTLEVDVDLDAIEWELSERAKRRAGTCLRDERTGEIRIRLTWRAFVEHGWEEMRKTIRHELVHAWEFQHFGEAGHGPRFRKKARELDAPRYCREFSDPRLRLVCRNDDCEWTAARHRASKTVTRPERRRCGSCGGEYKVRHVESGETWTSHEGYRAARDRIGNDW